MRLDTVFAALSFHRMTEFDWSSSDPDESLAYHFAMDTVHGYPAERLVLVKHQKVDAGPILSVLAPTAGVNWLPNVTCETF